MSADAPKPTAFAKSAVTSSGAFASSAATGGFGKSLAPASAPATGEAAPKLTAFASKANNPFGGSLASAASSGDKKPEGSTAPPAAGGMFSGIAPSSTSGSTFGKGPAPNGGKFNAPAGGTGAFTSGMTGAAAGGFGAKQSTAAPATGFPSPAKDGLAASVADSKSALGGGTGKPADAAALKKAMPFAASGNAFGSTASKFDATSTASTTTWAGAAGAAPVTAPPAAPVSDEERFDALVSAVGWSKASISEHLGYSGHNGGRDLDAVRDGRSRTISLSAAIQKLEVLCGGSRARAPAQVPLPCNPVGSAKQPAAALAGVPPSSAPAKTAPKQTPTFKAKPRAPGSVLPRLHVVPDVVGYASTVRVASACIGANTVLAIPLVGRTSANAEEAEKEKKDTAEAIEPDAARAGLAYADQTLACYEVTAGAADGDREGVMLPRPVVMRGLTDRSDPTASRVGPSTRTIHAHGDSRAVLILSDHGCNHTIVDAARNVVIDCKSALPVRAAAFHPDMDEFLLLLGSDGRLELFEIDYAATAVSAASRRNAWTARDAATTRSDSDQQALWRTVADMAVLEASVGTPAMLFVVARDGDVFVCDFDLATLEETKPSPPSELEPLDMHKLVRLHNSGPKATALGVVAADSRAGTYIIFGVNSAGTADFFVANETVLLRTLYSREGSQSTTSDKASVVSFVRGLDGSKGDQAKAPSKRKSKKDKTPVVDNTQRPDAIATAAANETGALPTTPANHPPVTRYCSMRLASDDEDTYEATVVAGRDESRNCFIVTLVPVVADSVASRAKPQPVVTARRHFLVSVPVYANDWNCWAYSNGAGFKTFPAASTSPAVLPNPVALPLPPCVSGFHLSQKPDLEKVPEPDFEAMGSMGYTTGAPLLCADTVVFVEAHAAPYTDTHVATTVTNPHFIPLQSVILAATTGPLAVTESEFELTVPPRVVTAGAISKAIRAQAQVLLTALHTAHTHLVEYDAGVKAVTNDGVPMHVPAEVVTKSQVAVAAAETELKAIQAAFEKVKAEYTAAEQNLTSRVAKVEGDFKAAHDGVTKAVLAAETSRINCEGVPAIYDLNEMLGAIGRALDSIERELDDEESAFQATEIAVADGIMLAVGGIADT